MIPALRRVLLVLVLVNAAYLAAFDSATLFYHVQVVAHVVLGFALAAAIGAAAVGTWRPARVAAIGAARPERERFWWWIAMAAGTVSFITACWLAKVGTAAPYRDWLWTHIVASIVACAAAAGWLGARGRARAARALATGLAIALLVPAGVRAWRFFDPPHVATIENPSVPPLTADQEGGGERNPFFPSSVETVGNRLIPADFFLESKACGNKGCHPDITAQWDGSMHHFSSFNNQWYRKSIEYMQEVVGTRPSKWCGGCHDQAVLLTGRMDTPIKDQIDTPQAQAGIGCLVCHSIVHVKDTMGQGGYVLEYPEMHRLVASGRPLLQKMHDYMVRLDPGPHKATMLKPFHRTSRAEFCSSCHKVHLDVPVNNYRWFRGFNEYDAWQQSGVSGQGARAFYYPEKSKDCGDCHMPLVKSSDQGNVNGYVHSHRFPAANTAVPTANQDHEQLRATQEFLTAGILSVDIFAASVARPVERPEPEALPEAADQESEPRAMTMFPDLGESDGPAGGTTRGRPGKEARPVVVAPIDRAAPFMRPGGTYRIDVVARTRNIGHFFPGGTVDAFDTWLELKAEDADGRTIYWNGFVEDDGHGPVDAGAHFYRSVPVDAHGNVINKRNAWAARAMVYARLIPPGAADVGRFRVSIPKDARGPITFTARMNYRKFSWWNTQFSFAGVRDPAVPQFALSPDYDDGPFIFTGDTSGVSGVLKEVPVLPITVIAEDRVTLPLAAAQAAGIAGGGPAAPAVPDPLPFDRERFNDYGIGMFLQGDLVAAKAAFETVIAVDPDYADGHTNLGRVLVQEGDHAAAVPHLEQALRIRPDLASAHYFLALALKARGRYENAITHLRAAAERFPRDRVVRNQLGRVLFLMRRHREAIAEFEQTLRVDPEDLTAHYNLMLCYRGLGETDLEKREEILYARFKADESAQAITGPYRRLRPEDNLERQPIHEHASRWRPPAPARADRQPGPSVTGAAGGS